MFKVERVIYCDAVNFALFAFDERVVFDEDTSACDVVFCPEEDVFSGEGEYLRRNFCEAVCHEYFIHHLLP